MPPAPRPRSAWSSSAPEARSRPRAAAACWWRRARHASIILAGLAPDQERLSVRVRSAGGPVAAAHPAKCAPRPHARRSRLHHSGRCAGPRPGHHRTRCPGSRSPRRAHRRARLRRCRAGPRSSLSRAPPMPWWTSSSTVATARRHCPGEGWSLRRPDPSPRFPWHGRPGRAVHRRGELGRLVYRGSPRHPRTQCRRGR